MNASITLTTITLALRHNAYLRPVCTALEVEWLLWDGQTIWNLLSQDKLGEGHLRSQFFEIRRSKQLHYRSLRCSWLFYLFKIRD